MFSDSYPERAWFSSQEWGDPGSSRDYFHGLLTRIVTAMDEPHRPLSTRLCEAALLSRVQTDPRAHTLVSARFNLMLTGSKAYAVTRNGARQEVQLQAGDAIYFPPHAVTFPFWTPCEFLGVVFFGSQVRFLTAVYRGGKVSLTPSPYAFHSSHGLEAPGLTLLQALNTLCEPSTASGLTSIEEREKLAGPVLEQLLRFCLIHLENEKQTEESIGRSFYTWQKLQSLIRESYTRDLSRTEAGAILGLHPSHVSALCRRYGNSTYQQLQEELRLERARYLLQNTPQNVATIAEQCGFSSSAYFIRVFRKATGLTPAQFRNQAR